MDVRSQMAIVGVTLAVISLVLLVVV